VKFHLVVLFAAVFVASSAACAEDRRWGVDLSHYNTVSDWEALTKSGATFVILKATDGRFFVDPAFAERFETLKRLSVLRGAYHFYETKDDPRTQAEWFVKNVKLGDGDLPPIVDIERVKGPVDGDVHKNFRVFLDVLEKRFGAKPIIYTGPGFWNHAMRDHLPSYPLWVAEYGAAAPQMPVGWKSWTLWQYTEQGQAAGIDGAVDRSYVNASGEGLKALLLK
jgi:lysozyme